LLDASDKAGENVIFLKEAIQSGRFDTFVLHALSLFYERDFLCEIFKNISTIRGAIVLVPEIGRIDKIATMLQSILGDRVCVLHSNQSRKKKKESIMGILSDKYDIVVGSRSAVFAPLKKISFVAVSGEHSPLYKAQEGLRYNARDVAIMRGFLEKAPVLLSSICPSLESIYNAMTGKFSLLKIPNNQTAPPHGFSLFSAKNRPVIRIIGKSTNDKKERSIPAEIINTAQKHLANREHLLFIISTRGYSLISCSDCGYIFRCQSCNMPLRFYKNERVLKCLLCGKSKIAPDTCNICGGIELKSFGTGTERIREDIEKLFGRKVLTLNKNSTLQKADNQLMPFVIGHGGQARRLKENTFMLAAFFDADISLAEPNFYANERVFENIIEISQLIKPNGVIFIITKNTKNKVLQFIKNYDFKGFYRNELSLRKETEFPPFTRLTLFNIFYNFEFNGLINTIENIFSNETGDGIEVLGPLKIASPSKSFKYCLQYLLKSNERKKLSSTAFVIKDKLNALKGIKATTDVDPIRL
jgi:primosomal protein N' (replication factor Y)